MNSDIERENALKALHYVRDKMYNDMLKLGWIDDTIPKEHYSPENLWEICLINLSERTGKPRG